MGKGKGTNTRERGRGKGLEKGKKSDSGPEKLISTIKMNRTFDASASVVAEKRNLSKKR